MLLIHNIYIALLSLILGVGITYLFCSKKLRKVEPLNISNQKLNRLIQEQLEHGKNDLKILQEAKEQVDNEYKTAKQELDDILKTISDYKVNAEKTYNKITNDTQNALDRELEKISNQFEEEKEKYHKEYANALFNSVNEFNKEIELKKKELKLLKETVEDEKKVAAAAIEANKRTLEMESKKDFYKLILSEEDKEEIKKLRTLLPQLRNAEPLNKVIWKVYYEKAFNDLVNRVIGSKIRTGIYKITNLDNGMCYIGQSVNISDRWKQHIKRGIGADTPTRNKLYPAMASFGVENFTFEIIEECDKTFLNEREKYWTDFFHAQDFGYSIRKG